MPCSSHILTNSHCKAGKNNSLFRRSTIKFVFSHPKWVAPMALVPGGVLLSLIPAIYNWGASRGLFIGNRPVCASGRSHVSTGLGCCSKRLWILSTKIKIKLKIFSCIHLHTWLLMLQE